MKISIIHPSKGRPEIAYRTIQKWLAYADMDVEYILSVDTEDVYWYFAGGEYFIMNKKIKMIHNKNKSAIEAINKAAEIVTGDLFIVVSDDFTCSRNWCSKLLRLVGDRTDFIVKTRDGIQKTLITLPIMDRKYYNRFGYIYHPEFLHMHCDEEMTIVAHMLGRVIDIDMTFEHMHYSVGKSRKDAINERNDSTWAHGQATLDRHALNNFGIENPLVKREDIVWK
jgi:hypothetical protein